MTLRASGQSACGWLRWVGAVGEPAHVAVLAGREEVAQPAARLSTQLGAAEPDRVETEAEGAVADQRFGQPRPR